MVEVPPPIAGHPEFVVHRSRFEASLLAKCWEVGDECQVRGAGHSRKSLGRGVGVQLRPHRRGQAVPGPATAAQLGPGCMPRESADETMHLPRWRACWSGAAPSLLWLLHCACA